MIIIFHDLNMRMEILRIIALSCVVHWVWSHCSRCLERLSDRLTVSEQNVSMELIDLWVKSSLNSRSFVTNPIQSNDRTIYRNSQAHLHQKTNRYETMMVQTSLTSVSGPSFDEVWWITEIEENWIVNAILIHQCHDEGNERISANCQISQDWVPAVKLTVRSAIDNIK
jgi:hypothetical protein